MISIRKKCVSSNYNNHNGMSLFDITGEAFPCKVLPRLLKFAVREYFECQCGFRSHQTTTDIRALNRTSLARNFSLWAGSGSRAVC